MKIGALAQRADVGIDTIRYYEREGMIPAPLRTTSGYRDYRDGDVARLRFVRRAKQLGFTLQEIRELLDLTASAADDMAGLNQRAQAKLDDVNGRIDELTRVRDALQQLVEVCPGHGALEHCPIMAALSEEPT
ncbi:MerR family transcriptional regulator [Thermomonas sp.]|uniref:MerR family transcriptional regulator n=1 Tax=Thermomonas sp. TaxID=1971895 RepID=UPI002489ED7F|nr:MerR family transcriptional regulator [Thermomonas sp.]MDI1252804.1 MerR family transcriptional regulator [Thermomonas sp.]